MAKFPVSKIYRMSKEHELRLRAMAATCQQPESWTLRALIDNEFTGENHDRYWPVYVAMRDGLTVKKEG